MSIKHYLTAFAGVAMLAACSDYDPGIAQKGVLDLTAEEEKFITEDYTDGFKIAMGVSNIDSDHSWGFPTESASAAKTRSANKANNNQWIHLNKDNQDDRNLTSITYIDDAPVPGFPSATDDLYHIYQDGNPVAKTYDEIVTMVKNGTDEVNPVGDVTDEEILYVSAWFRNHKNPTPDPLNVDHFYTQCISKDYDRTAYASENGLINEGTSNWAEGSGVGTWDKNIPINLYKNGVLSSVDRNGLDATGKYRQEDFQLDQLGVKASNDADYVHIYNDNAGNTSRISSENPTAINTTTWSALTSDSNPNMGIVSDQSYRSIMYMNQSGTTDFRAWKSGNSAWEYRWVLKHLTFTGRDGQDYDGWYLAFDMKFSQWLGSDDSDWDEETQTNLSHWEQYAEKDYDGYYSNYIVKITPGNGTVPPPPATLPSYRVMCEDLGNSYDFDFNDIVFDVDYEYTETEGTYKATVTLQAAGGTLPIYIYQYNAAHEAHNMLNGGLKQQGKETYRPINVREDDGKDFSVAPAQTFSFTTTSLNPDDIDIYVSNIGNIGTRVIKLPKAGEVTAAPMKFAVKDKTVKWMRESQLINLTYTHFPDWVTDDKSIYNPNTGSKPWTKTDLQNLGLLW